MFRIDVDKANELIEAKLSGLMSVDEVAEYIGELKRTFITHRLRDYVIIVDATECPVQLQDMIRSMGQHMATMPKARSIAVVTGSSLARMQVRRLFTQPYARITATVEEARAWVLSGTEPAVT